MGMDAELLSRGMPVISNAKKSSLPYLIPILPQRFIKVKKHHFQAKHDTTRSVVKQTTRGYYNISHGIIHPQMMAMKYCEFYKHDTRIETYHQDFIFCLHTPREII